jgi:hypothetical protein
LDFSYPAGTTYTLWRVSAGAATTGVSLGTCAVGGTIVDNGSLTAVVSLPTISSTEPSYTGQEVISAPNGTAPIVTASSTVVPNLNASFVNGHSLLVASFTTTAVASESVTITGMTSSGHCSAPGPTNASAIAGGVAGITAKTTNAITLTHTATAGMTFDFICTAN